MVCGGHWQVSDHEEVFRFRLGMYDFLGVDLPRKPARRVLFWMRPQGKPRSITNLQELLALTESYNVPYTYGSPWGSVHTCGVRQWWWLEPHRPPIVEMFSF